MAGIALAEQEYAVWQALQRLGRSSIRRVYEAVGAPRELAYTTVATVLNRLIDKRLVERERNGRSFVYWARRGATARKRIRGRSVIARVFGTGPDRAISALVDTVEAIDPTWLDRLAEEIAARRRQRPPDRPTS
jgi:predicted transcriptional regulator